MKNPRRYTSTGTGFSTTVPPKPPASARRPEAPPLTTASASGIQTVPAYKPTQNELNFVAALYADERDGKLAEGVAGQIDCIQLRKVTSAPLIVNNETRRHLAARAREFDVDPVY